MDRTIMSDLNELNELEWRKSRRSAANGSCVEVATHPNGDVLLRDTKDRGKGPVLRFTRPEWDVFVAGVRDGEVGLTGCGSECSEAHTYTGRCTLAGGSK